MIKIHNNWIDESEIKNMGKREQPDYNTKEKIYFITVSGNYGLHFDIPFDNEQLRDIEFDKLGKLLSKRGDIIDDKKDYIQGFKDGTEYPLKLNKGEKWYENQNA